MHHADEIIDLALREDVGPGDITTDNLVDPERFGTGTITAKEPMVVAGTAVAARVFERVDSRVRMDVRCPDGREAEAGTCIAELSGPLRALLVGERTALNFLQRLSGIATLVRRYAEALAGARVRLVDTRKTTPGWRVLEKYAVRVGGARNHRMGLYDGVLIKDNHIAAAGGIAAAVEKVRAAVSHLTRIEVEAATEDEVREALEAGADVIMLDNMSCEQIRRGVALVGGRALVEISGGVSLERLAELAATGADLISVGALTHGARSVDISMTLQP
jgi:nicotinate-nucleotide pyrophosphorylase (carboxylating)